MKAPVRCGSCPICLANARRTTTRRLRASFFGLTHQHGPAELARAVLEGVGYALADGMDVVHACGIKPQSITLIGGGARSAYWRQMLADISGLQLDYRTGGDVGPALGAARAGAAGGSRRGRPPRAAEAAAA